MKTLLVVLLFAAVVLQGSARPPRRREHPPNDGVGYLYKYGYLPKADMEKGVIRTEKDIRKATRMLQKFMGMKMTGNMDKDTMDMMKKPRCGVADMDMKDEDFREDGDEISPLISISPEDFKLLPGEPRWDKYHLTYSYVNYTPKLSEREVREALIQAFKMWSDATLLSFSEQTDPNKEADIKIQFGRYYHGDAYPFDEAGGYSGNVLAHAFPPGEGQGGDVHFDDYESWSVHTYAGINLLFVAVHEIGHALGLAHSEVRGSIMFPTYSGYDPNLQLHSDDEVIIQYLYGVNRGNPETRPPTEPTTTTTTTTTTEAPEHPTPTPDTPSGAPNPCVSGIDAAALAHMDGRYADSEIFMFKGAWYWRRSFDSMIENDLIRNKWPGLPYDLTHVDAVYQSHLNNRFTFFSGDRYWEFDYTTRHRDTPRHGRPLTDLGLPADIRKVDAAFIWGHNARSYLISGNLYWRLDDVTGKVDVGYPRSMDMWEGVPTPVDAAFQLWDGRTYFFKDQDFFVFNDERMVVETSVHDQMGRYWLWCQA